MNLVPHTDPVLREVAPPFDGDPRELEFTARQLHKLMIAGAYRGVGIAAPQAGLPLRMFLMNTRLTKWWQDCTVCINPEMIEARGELQSYNEGCLTRPGLTWPKSRQVDITVAYTNLAGERVTRVLEGLAARIFQHELDHLNGVVVWP